MKKLKRILALLLAITMLSTAAACGNDPAAGSSDAPDSQPSTESDQTPAEGDASEKYFLGYNNLGSGVWILDFYAEEIRYFVEDVMGFQFSAPSANFTADQLETDCRNLISSGINGHVYYGAFETLTPVISDTFRNEKIPFAMADQIPTGPVLDQLLENPYFAGAAGFDFYEVGHMLGSLAVEQGYSKGLIIAGPIGDVTMDAKIKGFTEAMEEGGGEVIGVARCSSPVEASEKADDLIGAYGAEGDCIFGANPDFSRAALNSMRSHNLSLQIFCSDLDNNMEDVIKSGEFIAGGGGAVCTSLSAALVVNYLDGHPILDENGKAPVFNAMKLFIVDKENYDSFIANWIDEHPITEAEFHKLLYRYNPDVTYQDWTDFADHYSYESIMETH